MTKENLFFAGRKKILLLSLASIIVILSTLYFCIPPGRLISKTILIRTNQNSLSRFLSDDVNRNKWWETCRNAKLETKIRVIDFQHYYLANLISVKMKIDDELINSDIRIIPSDSNTSYLKWQFERGAIKNPIKRIQEIFEKNAVEKDMQRILYSLKGYTEKIENIYGFKIEKMKVRDTIIAVTKSILSEYPSTSFIYDQIGRLKLYLRQQGVEEKDFPMLSIRKKDDGLFETTIGLPVNKVINSDKKIYLQYMIPGDILYMECKGGLSVIRRSFIEMENYMQDYEKTSPALPFESLITDRMKERDTLNWVTKIYYPVY